MELTAKEKAQIHAKDIFLKMYAKIEDITAGMFEEDVPYLDIRYRAAKQCALIAVDFAIDNIDWHEFEYPSERDLYLQQVKTEINNL